MGLLILVVFQTIKKLDDVFSLVNGFYVVGQRRVVSWSISS
ncbi:hypothetical protein HMPREF1991_00946 [Hoylesella loescheii DSM 19665 = JCM 12249 = ATCC 15930]|uniref:Uncharacterized protein n=1 Tax=Hoylesella loescheii DSM 19665 = JCM 12249 = ATCC 15930 TaxID=1122985 RepID=A0A069QT10_HOYLO|nr:hypothetical protein HMPREF1991_00946 [Hoylesella loescheii DSM 19665 = JCM 12249 = ATCC 15930]